MNFHGKYPTKKAIEYILKEINLNKGPNNRNALIRDYMIKYVNKKKFNKGELPKLTPYATSIKINRTKRNININSGGKENVSIAKAVKAGAKASALSNGNSFKEKSNKN